MMTATEKAHYLTRWDFWRRDSQKPPDGNWRVWLILAGRGWGKTRTGAEWIKEQVEMNRCSRLALVGPTAADCRDVMVEGESGLLAISRKEFRPTYEPSKRRLTWPNGALATTYSADEPERLRGPQHDGAWCDEPAAWKYPESWDMLMFGLRLGDDPRVVATTTPKPLKIIRDLLESPTTAITRGSTYENRGNLAPAFLEKIVAKYKNTRLGRQELMGEVLEEVEGALWTRVMVEGSKVNSVPDMARIVVAVDPAVTSTEESDRTGIVVAGLGEDARGYVLYSSGVRLSPDAWARKAVNLYDEYKADRIVAEANQGGDLVQSVIHTVSKNAPIRLVHASKGKKTRAEPVAALWEQKRFSILSAHDHSLLEDQMCTYTGEPGEQSPDVLDALVWAATELMLGENREFRWA